MTGGNYGSPNRNRGLSDTNRGLTLFDTGSSNRCVWMADTDCGLSYPQICRAGGDVPLTDAGIRLADANRGLPDSHVGLADADGCLADSNIRPANARGWLTEFHIAPANAILRLYELGFAMNFCMMGPAMSRVWKTDSPAIIRDEDIGLNDLRFRDDFGFGLDGRLICDSSISCGIQVWDPPTILESLPFALAPKDGRLADRDRGLRSVLGVTRKGQREKQKQYEITIHQ
jgi:hypothetical protein